MSDDLVARLRHAWDERARQLDEDERVAREITAPEWNEGCSWLADLRDPLPSQRRAYGLPKEWQLLTEADTKHIARWDPDRVLAEVERGRRNIATKRRILDAWPDSFGNWTGDQADAARAMKERVVSLLAKDEGLA